MSFSATFACSSLGGDPVDHLLVGDDDRLCLRAVVNTFAEQGGVRPQPAVVQAAQDGDAVVERLAGDEAARSQAHAVTANHAA